MLNTHAEVDIDSLNKYIKNKRKLKIVIISFAVISVISLYVHRDIRLNNFVYEDYAVAAMCAIAPIVYEFVKSYLHSRCKYYKHDGGSRINIIEDIEHNQAIIDSLETADKHEFKQLLIDIQQLKRDTKRAEKIAENNFVVIQLLLNK